MALPKLYWDKIQGSSNIDRTTWVPSKNEATQNGNMYIIFNNGWLYVFYDVPPFLYDNFKNSASKGQFFHANIRGKYDYNRLAKL